MRVLQNRFSKVQSIILYIIFAWIIVYFEEVVIGYELYKLHLVFLSIAKLSTPFVHLAQGEQNRFKYYYEGICKHHRKRLAIIAKESSIQLVLQNAILIYDFSHRPVTELYYQDYRFPTAQWIFIIIIRTISIFVSAYCTSLALVEDLNMKCYKESKKSASSFHVFVNVIKVLAHIALSIGLTPFFKIRSTAKYDSGY